MVKEKIDEKRDGESRKSRRAEPIRRPNDVKEIVNRLKGEPRNRLIFVIGVNTWLQIGTLRELKVGDVRHLKLGDRHYFDPPESDGARYLEVNKRIAKELDEYLTKHPELKDNEYLFQSRKGGKALTRQSVNRFVKKWTEAIGLKGNYGCESLRRTFGYIQRMEYGVGFDVLCQKFGHASPSITSKRLGISEDDPVNILNNKIG